MAAIIEDRPRFIESGLRFSVGESLSESKVGNSTPFVARFKSLAAAGPRSDPEAASHGQKCCLASSTA
ncbi:MAG TPA: hypothetical protein VN887_06955, partial [Candidatus Angelobacter sp.]|nr:hypothetical protein [Candidatus Angelobacter sp.]